MYTLHSASTHKLARDLLRVSRDYQCKQEVIRDKVDFVQSEKNFSTPKVLIKSLLHFLLDYWAKITPISIFFK